MPDVALYGSGLPAEENAAPIGSDGEGPGLAEMKRLRRLASVDGPKKQTRFPRQATEKEEMLAVRHPPPGSEISLASESRPGAGCDVNDDGLPRPHVRLDRDRDTTSVRGDIRKLVSPLNRMVPSSPQLPPRS